MINNIKMIAAVSTNGVIGVDNKIPWNYPEDFKFFRRMTTGGQVIFGRNTFESIGKPLPKRRNVVITRQDKIDGVECRRSLDRFFKEEALILYSQTQTYWLCGGENIYREGMKFASEIYLTLIPEEIKGQGLVFFPWIDPSKFRVDGMQKLENCELQVARYIRI